jgi:hypothetical protein
LSLGPVIIYGRGGGKKYGGGAICINKWLEGGGAIKFFQENVCVGGVGGFAIKFEGICL